MSPHERAIRRDLSRTFPEHSFFKERDGVGQESLFNVLKAYSVHDKEVGYCQGSPGLLLMQVRGCGARGRAKEVGCCLGCTFMVSRASGDPLAQKARGKRVWGHRQLQG